MNLKQAITDWIRFTTQSETPATPEAGFGIFYDKNKIPYHLNSDGVESQLGSVEAVNHAQVILTIEGIVNTTGLKPIRIHIPYIGEGATIEEVYLSVGTAPTTTALRINVYKNGETIFDTTQYVELATDEFSASKTTDFASSATLAKDDYLTFGVTQGDVAAADLTVHIRYKWTLTGV